MIVLISKKKFCKYHKKLLKKTNYGIINGTAAGNKILDEIGAIRSSEEDFDYLRASSSLTKKSKIEAGVKGRKLDAYLSKLPRAIACAAALQLCNEDGEIDPEEKINKNVYVILTNKTYKALAGKIKKCMMKYMKLTEEDGDVVVLFDKFPKSLKEYGNTSALINKELEALDKKINNLQSDLNAGEANELWSDSDIEAADEKLKKLRKERKALATGDASEGLPDSVRVRLILKEGAVSKSARKKLSDYIIRYHEHNGSEAYLSRRV